MFRLEAGILVAGATIFICLRGDPRDRINVYIKETALELGVHAAGGEFLAILQFDNFFAMVTGLSF